MKKLIWFVFFHSACFHQQVSAQKLQSEGLRNPGAGLAQMSQSRHLTAVTFTGLAGYATLRARMNKKLLRFLIKTLHYKNLSSNNSMSDRDTEFPGGDATVMFSCISRPDELGPMLSTEIDGKKYFQWRWQAFLPGEFGRATNGKNEYHNTTCCRWR